MSLESNREEYLGNSLAVEQSVKEPRGPISHANRGCGSSKS
jgi:hypothetical protein